MNYDPNICNRGKAKQTVRLTFGLWDYSTEKEATICGNCMGLDVIEAAVETVFDSLETNDYDVPTINLYKNDEEDHVLECEDDEDEGDVWLKKMLIKAEIIKIE